MTSAQAQIETYDTRPYYEGSTTTFSAGTTIGQTFTNVLAVQSMTYNFFQGTGSLSGPVTLEAVFGQWNMSTSSFIAGTTVTFTGGASIDAANTWNSTLVNGHGSYPTFEYTFDLSNTALWSDPNTLLNNTTGYETNAGNVYALMLTNSGASTNLALGQTNTSSAFSFGQAYQGGGDYFRDWTFAQLNVVPVPTPESSTVASIAAALLVAGLMVLRLRQRRQQLALAPVTAA